MTVEFGRSPEPAVDAHTHSVHFYERDDDLADRVVEPFIGAALLSGEAAVIIASERHRELFMRRLRDMDIDVEAARAEGNLTILDAPQTLAKIMVEGAPDPDLFRRVVGSVIEASCTRGTKPVRVRAYGEMVDLLWQADNRPAAVALEEMWNELAESHPFDLLCAYSMAGFRRTSHESDLAAVCDEHTGVSVADPAEGDDGPAPPIGQTRALAAEIAHRKQLEQLLRATIQRLQIAEASQRRRADQAERLVGDLRESLRVNEMFMGVLAHDLRAPLAAIMTAVQLMMVREANASDGRNSQALSRVFSSSQRMSRMIEQLLDFTRLRVAGGIALEPQGADMAALVRAAVDELQTSYPGCTVQVSQLGDTTGTWDVDRLGQVLSNLVANALQHGDGAAGVRVSIDGRAAGGVRVAVHNMGTIPTGLIGQVFDPLSGGQRRRDRSRGMGLGLFITKQLVAAHGGDVAVSSSEADGTTFTVTLPRHATPMTAEAPLGPSAATQGTPPARESINLAGLAHDQLRAIETRFRLLVEAVKDYAIFMLDPSGRVVTWNAGAERIKGYQAKEIIGHHFSEFYDPAEVRAGKCEHELEAAIRDGRFEDEGWRIRKDGSKFWANVVITALRTENGDLVGFAKVTRDLTDRRRLEAEQLRLARAEEAIRLRDEFLSLAAHELKTPLTVLQLQLDTLSDRLDDAGQRVATKLQRAAQSSERLAHLVESLLDVSRIATGRFALDIREIDLVECVNRVVDGLRPSADRSRCDISVEARGPVVGSWDRLRLEQALTNMLANAIKYGAGKPILVSVRQHGAEVLLDVRDHGPGIPEGELTRLFRRFERAASIRNYGGLGLGLYFIQAIVDAHGGSVTAQNMPDGGARFQITLPLRTVALAAEDCPTTTEIN
jgi:PAS domain S-box-containing protein